MNVSSSEYASLTLDDNGEAYIEIFGESDFDYVQADSIHYGGLLNVTFSGSGWTNGARFQVLEANTHSGAATTCVIIRAIRVAGIHGADLSKRQSALYSCGIRHIMAS